LGGEGLETVFFGSRPPQFTTHKKIGFWHSSNASRLCCSIDEKKPDKGEKKPPSEGGGFLPDYTD
jgi:hypothetical protein